MALATTTIAADQWTKIGNNVTSITFQNLGDTPMLVEYTAADSAPADAIGTVYDRYEGEMKKTLTDLTFVSSPAYVWARSITASTTVVYEGA